MRISVYVVVIPLSVGILTQGAGKEATVQKFTISSSSFRNDQPIPAKYSRDGEDISPSLKWEGAPDGTGGFALICDDPDAPGGTWIHWVIYGIPVDTTELPEGIKQNDTVAVAGSVFPKMGGWKLGFGSDFKTISQLPGAKQGVNSYGDVGYGGPQPPRGHGAHHYHFQLYALDTELNLAARMTRQQLDAAMKGHIIAEAQLVGTFQRD
jgi:Raf kinase inhibitor-like YbhB/YbcL family protein